MGYFNEMEFKAKLVVGKKNPKARIAWAGGVVLVASVLVSLMHGYSTYSLWGFGGRL